MGRIYTAQFNGVEVSADQDLFEIVAPADSIVQIHEIGLGNKSEIGDAMEEMLLILWKSGQTSAGSGGSAPDPDAIPRLFADAAFGGVVLLNNTTPASGGTIVTHYAWGWNIRSPFTVIFTPETRPTLSPSRRGTLTLPADPTDAITMSGYIVIEEIGG